MRWFNGEISLFQKCYWHILVSILESTLALQTKKYINHRPKHKIKNCKTTWRKHTRCSVSLCISRWSLGIRNTCHSSLKDKLHQRKKHRKTSRYFQTHSNLKWVKVLSLDYSRLFPRPFNVGGRYYLFDSWNLGSTLIWELGLSSKMLLYLNDIISLFPWTQQFPGLLSNHPWIHDGKYWPSR